ncbi:MAG: YibE/F family protein [Sporomusaceae bacterium]|nr:YibE/F family protein [Sporomusaceae bacterium]
MRLGIAILLLLVVLFTMSYQTVEAAPEQYEKAVVQQVMILPQTEKKAAFPEKLELVALELKTGPHQGETVTTVHHLPLHSVFSAVDVAVGDRVVVIVSQDSGETVYHISDFEREPYLYGLLALFALSLILFGGKIGLKALLVIALSCGLILKVFISLLVSWQDHIILLVFLLCSVIVLFTQTVISGWNVKVRSSILGAIGGVAIAGILAHIAISLMHLTGLESEEAMMLKATALPNVDFQGVLFAGMMLGALGAVMDVTISIASAVAEIKSCLPDSSFRQLFRAGMNVGRDIMGTMANTLILAYVGSSLPLLLLISVQKNMSMEKLMNFNMIATEIVRALTGSIGLVCSIPLTALLAAWLFQRRTSLRK